MEKNFNFDVEKFVSDLKNLGVKVTENSEQPGFFTTLDGKSIELSVHDIFPEFRRLITTSGQFQADEVVELPAVLKVQVKQRDKAFTDFDSTVGAA